MTMIPFMAKMSDIDDGASWNSQSALSPKRPQQITRVNSDENKYDRPGIVALNNPRNPAVRLELMRNSPVLINKREFIEQWLKNSDHFNIQSPSSGLSVVSSTPSTKRVPRSPLQEVNQIKRIKSGDDRKNSVRRSFDSLLSKRSSGQESDKKTNDTRLTLTTSSSDYASIAKKKLEAIRTAMFTMTRKPREISPVLEESSVEKPNSSTTIRSEWPELEILPKSQTPYISDTESLHTHSTVPVLESASSSNVESPQKSEVISISSSPRIVEPINIEPDDIENSEKLERESDIAISEVIDDPDILDKTVVPKHTPLHNKFEVDELSQNISISSSLKVVEPLGIKLGDKEDFEKLESDTAISEVIEDPDVPGEPVVPERRPLHTQFEVDESSQNISQVSTSQGESVDRTTFIEPVISLETSVTYKPPEQENNQTALNIPPSKKKKKKYKKGSLMERLQTIIDLQKSDLRIWKHQQTKREWQLSRQQYFVFKILCSTFLNGMQFSEGRVTCDSNNLILNCLEEENIFTFTRDNILSKTVTIATDPEVVGRIDINAKSVLRIYPPWSVLDAQKLVFSVLYFIFSDDNVVINDDEKRRGCAIIGKRDCPCLAAKRLVESCPVKFVDRKSEAMEYMFGEVIETCGISFDRLK